MEAQWRTHNQGGGPAARRQPNGRPTASRLPEGKPAGVLRAKQDAAAQAVQRVWRGHVAREAIADRLWSEINHVQAQSKQAHAGQSSAPQLEPQPQPQPQPQPEPEPEAQLEPEPEEGQLLELALRPQPTAAASRLPEGKPAGVLRAKQDAAAQAVQRVWRGHVAREAIADRLWSEINHVQAQSKQAHAGQSSAPQLEPQPQPQPQPQPEPEPEAQLEPEPEEGQLLELALRPQPTAAAFAPTSPASRVTGIVGIRRRTPCPYPENLPEWVTPQSERAQNIISPEKLESNRLRNSIVSSPEAQRLRELRDEGRRLVSPLQLPSSLHRQLLASDAGSLYTRTPYERRIQQLRESHARDATMQPHAIWDSRRDLPMQSLRPHGDDHHSRRNPV